jgi:hypothetical protein
MVFSKEYQEKILKFVKKEPRTVNDIAKLLGKSWLTVNSYIERINEDTGLINIKTFRGGTRGALKIVYWNYVETIENEDIQKELFERIRLGQKKEDFDPLDVFQFIESGNKKVFAEEYTEVHVSKKQNFVSLLRSAEHEVLCFSGNLSWINVVEGEHKIYDVLKEVAANKVAIKILGRVDIASIKNVDMISKLNSELGREAIECRHKRHPLRGFVIDNKLVRLKEEKDTASYKKGELERNTRLFYEITDTAWVDWFKKVFWALFRYAVPAERRIKELEMI